MLPLIALLALSHFDLAAYERPRLVREADSVLGLSPKTIVAAVNPRSAGGSHDWSSEGDYWWPDPSHPDGPYIQRDGLTNPDNFIAHRELMLDFVRAFDALAAAYRVTGDERYAAAAVRHLHAWYVDPAARMNPNLQYAQAIHGRYTGRGTGVIDTVHFAEVARTKPYGYSIFNLDVMTALAVVLSTPDENLMNSTLPDGRNLVKGVAFLAPFLADKSRWPKKPDVMYWNDWPVRQPCLIFGALAAGRKDWLETWERLDPDPTVEEIRRNFPVRQPILWMR
jgi:hypothetical protein